MEFILIIVGLVFFAVGVFLVVDQRKFRDRAYGVRGKVIGIERYVSTSGSGSDRRRSTFYRPIVEYVAGGSTYHLGNTGGRERILHRLNQTVPVLVARDNPADARLDSNHATIIGVVFALAGLGSMVVFPFVYEFSWLSVAFALFLLVSILIVIARVVRKINVGSFQEFKQQFREANLAGKLAGSAEDPMLIDRAGTDAVLFQTRQEVGREKRRIAFIERIILLVSLVLGLVLLWFGWGIYEKEMASSSPDEIKAYALLVLGGIFVLASLPRLLKR